MATITNATTIYTQVRGGTTRWRFRYVLDNGEVHERNAWVPTTTDEATERTARGVAMLAELAEAEAARLLEQ